MILKILLIMGLALACECYNLNCESCYEGGTYKCGTSDDTPCVCNVGYGDGRCYQNYDLSHNDCIHGTIEYIDKRHECVCENGFWGRLCEHSDSEVEYMYEKEKKVAQKYCRENEECEPPRLPSRCKDGTLNDCDRTGNVIPSEKCPYPWYCFDVFRDGKCDWECERVECLYDGYECSTNRACNKNCLTKSGICDSECDLRAQEKEYEMSTNKPDIAPYTMEFTLGISEKFWWENQPEIIANISEPIRTSLMYVPHMNEDLEKRRYSLENVLSRGRRSVSKESQEVVVRLLLMSHFCSNSAHCAKDDLTAATHLTVAAMKFDPKASYIKNIRAYSQPKGAVSTTLGVCFFIVAVPIVLIVGYRVVSAPIWFPPKSEKEAPVMWCSVNQPFNGNTPTYLHEEAYSNLRISLPIRLDYVNRMDDQGRTPLFWLISSEKDVAIIQEDLDELLKGGANVNHSDHGGETPLSIAIQHKLPTICDRLMKWGADLTATNNSGASCLHSAVHLDYVEMVIWLLNFPAVRNNINEVDEFDRTPLAIAALGGKPSARIAQILIDAGADPIYQGNQSTMWRYRGRTALHWAAQFDNLGVMKVLLEHRPPDINCVDTEGCTALHFAVQRGSEAAVRMLLDAKASTEISNGFGETPLSIANKNGSEHLIALITWYSNARKEELAIKQKGKKKRPSDNNSGSAHLKRTCPPDSFFYSDSTSNYSDPISGYVFPPSATDSSSIGSGSSMNSSSSSTSSFNMPSYQWSPITPTPSSVYVIPSKSRYSPLPPIQEQSVNQSPYDLTDLDDYIPSGDAVDHSSYNLDDLDVYFPSEAAEPAMNSAMNSDNVMADYDCLGDSVLLSPSSENGNHESGQLDSPREHLGTSYWTEPEKPDNGFNEDLLHEFFVDWHN